MFRFPTCLSTCCLVLSLAACGGGSSGGLGGPNLEGFSEVLVVTNHNNAGPGSLRNAVSIALPNAAVVFDAALPTGTINLISRIEIEKPVTIGGLSGTLGRHAVNGGNAHVLFNLTDPGVDALLKFELRDLVLTDGYGTGNGGAINGEVQSLVLRRVQFVSNHADTAGGAFGFTAPVNVIAEDCAFTANTAAFAGAIRIQDGTGMFRRCSFYLNQSTSSGAGAIYGRRADLTFYNSTFILNTAAGNGGAVLIRGENSTPASAYFYASTVVGNDASSGGGIYASSLDGQDCDVRIHASIVAENTGGADPDIDLSAGPTTADGSYSLLGIGPVGMLFNGLNDNQVGDAFTPLDPLLQAVSLDALGRAYRTPAAGSPAIDVFGIAPPAGFPLIDMLGQQRGVGAYDAGAIERQ